MVEQFVVDRAGFPMRWIEEADAYVHFFPVTKIQIETFLSDVENPRFDGEWYGELCALNDRVSPGQIRGDNYWQALATGLLPDEANLFCEWCGEDYRIPSLEDWVKVYRSAVWPQAEEIPWGRVLGEGDSRRQQLLEALEQAGETASGRAGYRPRKLADQMLLRQGIVEWVRLSPGWGGMGELPPNFQGLLFSPERGEPLRPNRPDEERNSHFGMRLFRRRQ